MNITEKNTEIKTNKTVSVFIEQQVPKFNLLKFGNLLIFFSLILTASESYCFGSWWFPKTQIEILTDCVCALPLLVGICISLAFSRK